MRGKIFFLMLLAAFATSTRAQGTDDFQAAVTNDDGGKAFIVKTFQLNDPNKIGAPLDGLYIEQYSIFLGGEWAEPDLRRREADLSNLLLNVREHLQPEDIERLRNRNRFAPAFSQEKLDVAGNRNVSDLEIQRVLAGMFKDGTLPPTQAGVIYVIFLDSTLHSTLGPLVAEKHYQSYHAFFNASGARVHYVVMPFQADPSAADQIALRSLLVAASHP
jgi:hypothetical protein